VATDFDAGYCVAPFDQLVRECPDATVYPPSAFRTEWGPVFHRGRLDGSARVLVIGQDPAQHEEMARRILIGVAGHRTQGLLGKLGVDRSYVMVNTFLYSVYGQQGGTQHQGDPGIVAYRNRWLDALLVGSGVEAVIALGALADGAWQAWKATPSGHGSSVAYAHVTHPTAPRTPQDTTALLHNWNAALQALHPTITHPDRSVPLTLYGDAFTPADLVPIPAADLPAGSPPWMLGADTWAARTGATAQEKRYTITLTVPAAFQS